MLQNTQSTQTFCSPADWFQIYSDTELHANHCIPLVVTWCFTFLPFRQLSKPWNYFHLCNLSLWSLDHLITPWLPQIDIGSEADIYKKKIIKRVGYFQSAHIWVKKKREEKNIFDKQGGQSGCRSKARLHNKVCHLEKKKGSTPPTWLYSQKNLANWLWSP